MEGSGGEGGVMGGVRSRLRGWRRHKGGGGGVAGVTEAGSGLGEESDPSLGLGSPTGFAGGPELS